MAVPAYDAEVEFWAKLTGWQLHDSVLPEFRALRQPAGLPIRILLQRLASDRPASAHLDLACSDRAATRAEHERRGAVVVDRRPRWIVMRDPAGGVYCLTIRDPHTGTAPRAPQRRLDSTTVFGGVGRAGEHRRGAHLPRPNG